MTTVTTNTSYSANLGRRFLGFFKAIWIGLVAIAESGPRMKKLEYLTSLSDKQLAAKGLKREDIVRVVFSDKLYL